MLKPDGPCFTPYTTQHVINVMAVVGFLCIFDWLFGSDPMSAASAEGYEETMFLSSMFRNQAVFQLGAAVTWWFRADDPIIEATFFLIMTGVSINYWYDFLYAVPGKSSINAYIGTLVVVLAALPKIPRCW